MNRHVYNIHDFTNRRRVHIGLSCWSRLILLTLHQPQLSNYHCLKSKNLHVKWQPTGVRNKLIIIRKRLKGHRSNQNAPFVWTWKFENLQFSTYSGPAAGRWCVVCISIEAYNYPAVDIRRARCDDLAIGSRCRRLFATLPGLEARPVGHITTTASHELIFHKVV